MLDPAQQYKLEYSFIRDVKVGARILPSQYGKVPLPLILDVGLSHPELFASANRATIISIA
jgi:hypothetical protein